MTFAIATLAHAPLYVWLLLAWLLYRGATGLRPRTQPVMRVMLLPLAFVIWGVLPLLFATPPRLDRITAWVAGLLLLLPIGVRTGPTLLAVDRPAGTVTRAGSAVPLVGSVGVFVVQYALAVAVATGGGTWDGAGLLLVSRAVSGATTGYFGGWALRVWRQYRAAPT